MSERLAQLTKLHQLDPKDPFLTYGIAMEHSKAQDFDTAIIWFDRTLEVDPNYCYAFYQKARALSEQGNDDAARQVLTQGMAAATRAGDAHAHSEMAELLSSLE
jgi:tetratricopeptide (TPR) repeat protein